MNASALLIIPPAVLVATCYIYTDDLRQHHSIGHITGWVRRHGSPTCDTADLLDTTVAHLQPFTTDDLIRLQSRYERLWHELHDNLGEQAFCLALVHSAVVGTLRQRNGSIP